MKAKGSQLNLCGNCGKPIKGPAHTVRTTTGKAMTFHTDAMGCAYSEEPKRAKISDEGLIHTRGSNQFLRAQRDYNG